MSLRCVSTGVIVFLIAACGGGSGAQNEPPPTNDPVNPRPLSGTLQSTTLPPPSDLTATPAGLESFVAFESGQVRPLALYASASKLLAVNTPDNRLEIFSISGSTLAHESSVAVGLEPVAVAVTGDDAWVVNHLSDSVSVVSLSATPPRVVRTLHVGDEPRDIVFAGPNFERAFISTAHRGQHAPFDPQLNTPGVGRADVWVFDKTNLGGSTGGTPLKIITMFGDTPRALAVSADGSKVYAAVFNSGNQTTVVRDVPTSDKAAPFANIDGVPAPLSALVLKFDGTNWVDEQGRQFNARASLNLPDLDVFEINALAANPTDVHSWSGVGTTLFNMAVNPVSGKVYVSNLESHNAVRFARSVSSGTTVRGQATDNRITVLGGAGDVTPVHLNSHIDRTREFGTAAENAQSLALPMELAVSDDGASLFATAMGSDKVAVLSTADLENAGFDPASAVHIDVSGGGPTGIVLDAAREQAYVLTRFDNGISVIDLATQTETSHVTMFNPEPPEIVNGRRFLYDAKLTSSTGDSACASCHIFGDTDHLAWDLGDPDAAETVNPFGPVPFTNPITGGFRSKQPNFHPMKGPKATQSLRGLANHGPMHWRGDRTGENAQSGDTQEQAAFKEFNESFVTLLGRETELSGADMQAFTDFALRLRYPPNPHRPLDGTLTADQNEGRRVYTGVFTSPGGTVGCNTCHVLNTAEGVFGSAKDFIAVLGFNEQDFKVPHFRNIYQKVGFFRGGLGQPQIRGFGLSEPGSTAGLLALINSGEFRFENDRQPEQLASFIFAFPSLLAPIVGQQVSWSPDSPADAETFIDGLFARAQVAGQVPECDLVAKGVWGGETRGAVRQADNLFQTDRAAEVLTLDQLKDLGRIAGNHVTFTCVPPNSGIRIGIDRNLDGVLDGDEI